MFLNEKNIYRISAISLGFTTIITQIIIIREFLAIYSNNELIIGILFSNWMLLTGLGAYLGKFYSKNEKIIIVFLQLLIGILPIVTVFSLSAFRNVIFTPGKMLSPFEIYYSSLALLAPFCIFSGFLFTRLSKTFSGIFAKNLISDIYSFEAIGSITGGLLFNFIFLFVLSSFESLKILFVLNFVLAVTLLLVQNNKVFAAVTGTTGLIIAIIIIPKSLDYKALSYLYPNQEIIDYKETPFGKITVTKTANQLNFYENGTTLFTTENTIENEENIHYAMVQHPKPENILLISGGISGTMNEILKYNIKSLDYPEINPWLIKEGEKFTNNIVKNRKIRIVNMDARLFLKKTSKKYDVVIINLPAPSNLEINRYYTLEFFEEMKSKMNKNGVLSVSLPPTVNYAGAESIKIQSVIFSTLKKVFQNVIIIPGGRNYFLASNGKLSYNISKLISEKGISTEYVNEYYIDDEQIKERGNKLINEINTKTEINRDFKPVAGFLQWKYWLSYFNISGNIWILLLTIPLLIIALRMNPINLGLFATGLTSASMEIIIIVSFQIIYGFIYQMTGIIITAFMIGLAAGSYKLYRYFSIDYKTYYRLQGAIGLFTLIIPLGIILLKAYSGLTVAVYLIFLTIIIGSGIMTGIQFSIATKLSDGETGIIASKTYASEITGSAAGTLIVSAVLIPIIGIFNICYLIGVMNIVIAIVIYSSRKKV